MSARRSVRLRPRVAGAAVSLAREAASRAYAPYSGFRVGAVLEDSTGALQAGCNVECASIGLSLCAERAALGLALARGARSFRRLWIYTPTPQPTTPCGACRELLARVGDDLIVILLCEGQRPRRIRMSRLLPAGGTGRKGAP